MCCVIFSVLSTICTRYGGAITIWVLGSHSAPPTVTWACKNVHVLPRPSNCNCKSYIFSYECCNISTEEGAYLTLPPPCISYANVHNFYGPYAYCSLDKGVACTQHIQLLTHTCAGHMC